jgi:hypothetical protein
MFFNDIFVGFYMDFDLCKKLRSGVFVFFFFFSSCVRVQSSYFQDMNIETSEKAENEVVFFTKRPQRLSYQIGVVTVSGNRYATFDSLKQEAVKRAAKVGGDFILIQSSGVETRNVWIPGHSSFHASSSCNYNAQGNVNTFLASGYGSSQASGYSQGPSMYDIKLPWANFSVWVYMPSQLGIRFEDLKVVGFHLHGNAQSSGIRIGDQLVGVDDIDVSDQGFVPHLMKIMPGDSVKLTFQRSDEVVCFNINSIKN